MMKTYLWKVILLYPILVLTIPGSFAYATPPDHKPIKSGYNIKASPALKSINGFHDTLAASIINTKKLVFAPEIKLHSSMEGFVKDYMKQNDEMLDYILLNRNSSFTTIEKVLEKHGLPVELKYLAVIESKLKSSATSRVGAAGMWQLMPGTARELGLTVAGKTDERRYAYKSSVAAAKYLNDLYKQYDDWLLVIAAYNSGPGYVNKAIKRSGSREFWKLQNFLPKETRMHVKKFIATHFYYEEKGSLVTLTKKEREKYLLALKEFEAIHKEDKIPGTEPDSTNSFFNWVVVTQDEHFKLKAISRR
jgi:membrane-bound lytic murein transglycosylase D